MLESRNWVGVFAGLALVGCFEGASSAEPADTAEAATATEALPLARLPALPDQSLAVPAGHRLAFALDATGVQIYECRGNSGTFGWVLEAPEATLYDGRGRIAGKHYAGPTWEHRDRSTVAATRVAGFTPDPTAIPALLLAANTHTGRGRMTGVTYIQRLETVGGLAPAGGCDADRVNARARVDYAATYYFYEARGAGCR